MNNFIVSPDKDRQMRVWLYAAVVTTVLTYIRPFIFAIDSGNVGMIAIRKVIDNEWYTGIVHIAYWVLFIWGIGQLLMSFPSSMKWTKGTLWVVLATYVMRILFGYITPLPDMESPSFATYQWVSNGLSMVYTAALLLFGYLLVRNHKGRLRQLGIAIIAWQLAPFIFSWMFILFYPLPAICQLFFHFVQGLLTICTFITLRRAYVPMWN